MSKVIEFEQINLDDQTQKSRVQFESKIFDLSSGKQSYPVEETDFIFQEFSGFAPKKFIVDPDKRDFVKIQLDLKQKSCVTLKNNLLKYDEAYENNKKKIFGKWEKLYKYIPAVRPPKSNDETCLSDDEEKEVKVEPNAVVRYENAKMKLKVDWFYYYEGNRLDKTNINIVKKTVSELMTNAKTSNMDKEKKKIAISSLVVKLTFMEDGIKVQKDVSMKEIEQRKEIDTKVFYRRPEKLDLDAKKPNECTEDELVKYYGDPLEPKDVRSADDLDKYYKYKSFVRLLYTPFRLWASKDKLPGADKRTCGIKFIINSIDIIQLPYENNNLSSQRVMYSKYAFGKKNDNLLINQTTDNVFTGVEKQVVKQVEKQVEKEKPVVKQVEKKQIEVESESDTESSEESDESDSDSESSEEEKVKSSKKGNNKTPIKKTK